MPIHLLPRWLCAGKPFWALQILAWSAYGLSTYLASLPNLAGGQYALVFAFKVARTAVGFGASLVLWRLYRALESRGASRGAIAAAAVVGSAIFAFAWLVVYRQLTASFRPPELPSLAWAVIPRAALDYAFVLLAWSGAYLGLRLYQQRQDEERRALEAAEQAREAELRMLRYQLDPHFLFNALNSLRAAIPLAAEVPRGIVDELATFLRHTLEATSEPYTPLEKEISGVRSYLAIEKVRFGERLDVQLRVDREVAEARIPGFLLHPLVENAIKHGIASGCRPLRVAISATGDNTGMLTLEIENTLAASARTPHGDGLGIGLENVRRRVALAYGDAASFEFRVEDGWAHAIVRIPCGAEVNA